MALIRLKLLTIPYFLLVIFIAVYAHHEDKENLPAAPQSATISNEEIAIVIEENPAAPPAEIKAMEDVMDKPPGKPKAKGDGEDKKKPKDDKLPPKEAPKYVPNYGGAWELHSEDSGVSAMHLNIMPITNQGIMYDATILGPSKIKLTDKQGCRLIDPNTKETDCWAHAVEYNTETAEIRPLKVNTDTWCSSGSLTIEGALVSVGGNKEGAKTVRYLSPCVDCEWREYPNSLAEARWYATQAILADNRYIIVGGRAAWSYEFMPLEGKNNPQAIDFPFLKETMEDAENNLYPFVHLSTDGNVFILANDRSILLDPYENKIIREYPKLEGGSRNYPASGMSALLPITLSAKTPDPAPAEVLVCGGALHNAYNEAMNKNFLPALDDCNRIVITAPDAKWATEKMPHPRVMGDMQILPNGDILMINGAKRGTAAWYYAEDPNFIPVLYKPNEVDGRFVELAPTNIARMYHSSSAILIDGKVLVAGSNTHERYIFDGPYPTEVRVEKFSPPYLAQELKASRPEISKKKVKKFKLGSKFNIKFEVEEPVGKDSIRVTLYQPAFTTHGVNMNQRLIVLQTLEVEEKKKGQLEVTVLAPAKPEVAPAGYYMLFVCNGVVPSEGIWVQLKNAD